jgi:initiation factor 1A
MDKRKDKKGGYSKHLKKGGGKKAVLYDALDDGQLFGQITKIDGEGRFRILCNDGITRRGKACNQIRKTKDKKICLETFVIVSLRDCDTNDDKCDILGFADPPKDIILYFKNNNKEVNTTDIMFEAVKNETVDNEEIFDVDDL